MARSNTKFARGISTSRPDAASWDAFDALPPRVRLALWEAPVSINPLQVRDLVDDGGADYAVEQIVSAVRGELAMFAADYRARFGVALPWMAAQARLQSYWRRASRSQSRSSAGSARATRVGSSARWAVVAEASPG
jgi:hypothetical protein